MRWPRQWDEHRLRFDCIPGIAVVTISNWNFSIAVWPNFSIAIAIATPYGAATMGMILCYPPKLLRNSGSLLFQHRARGLHGHNRSRC